MKIRLFLRNIVALIFPSGKQEWAIFLCFFSLYGILGSYIALNYRIIFDNRIPWDAYFSFDNRAIVMNGGGFERHPLTYYFFGWIRKFALLFSGGKLDETFRLVLALCSNLMVSLSIIQVFKYLKNIIQLPLMVSLFILVFYALFSTNIILSFTPETYAYSLFFLTLFHYYAGLKIRDEKKIPLSALALSTTVIGGITTTNLVKVFIPILFEKNLFKNFWNFWNATLRVLVSLAVFILLFLYRIQFNYQLLLNQTGTQFEKFTQLKQTPLWDMVFSWFFGGNILFSGFVIKDYSKNHFDYKALFMDVYSSVYSYIFVGMVFGLIFWSYCRNFKNKWVQILMFSFFVDVIIHCILKFGINCAYIYGGHFVFIVPLLLGWLFQSYKNSPKLLSFLVVMIIILLVYLGMNNLLRMEEFFQFIEIFYNN